MSNPLNCSPAYFWPLYLVNLNTVICDIWNKRSSLTWIYVNTFNELGCRLEHCGAIVGPDGYGKGLHVKCDGVERHQERPTLAREAATKGRLG